MNEGMQINIYYIDIFFIKFCEFLFKTNVLKPSLVTLCNAPPLVSNECCTHLVVFHYYILYIKQHL